MRPDHAKLPGTKPRISMPIGQYKLLTERDLDAIVAYLRSIPAIRNELPGPVYKAGNGLRHRPVRRSTIDGRSPTRSCSKRTLSRRYRALHGFAIPRWREAARSCECLWQRRPEIWIPPVVTGYPAEWKGSVAPNITSDKKSGLGDWSDADIKRAIAKGISRDGQRVDVSQWVSHGFATLKDR